MTCRPCNGSGEETHEEDCWWCKGQGTWHDQQGTYQYCWACKGQGTKTKTYKCSTCDGTGETNR